MCVSKAEGGQRCYTSAEKGVAYAAQLWREAKARKDEVDIATAGDNSEEGTLARSIASSAVKDAFDELRARRVELASTVKGENELRAIQVSDPKQYKAKMAVVNDGIALRHRNKLVQHKILTRDEADKLTREEAHEKVKELEETLAASAREEAREKEQTRRAQVHAYVDKHGTTPPAGQEPHRAKAKTLRPGDVLANGFVVHGTSPSRTPRKVNVIGAYPPKHGQERNVHNYEWGRDTQVSVSYNAHQAITAESTPAVAAPAPDGSGSRSVFSHAQDVNQVINEFDAQTSTELLTDDGELPTNQVQERYDRIVTDRDARLAELGKDLPDETGHDLSPAERAIVHNQGWDNATVDELVTGWNPKSGSRVDELLYRAANEYWDSVAAR